MTKLEIDLADILGQKYPHGFHVPADVDLSTFLEFADDDWRHQLDLHALLAHSQQVALVFGTADVKKVRPDLDDDQAWEILQQFQAAAEDCPDPRYETMRPLADQAYPPAPQAKQRLLDTLRSLTRQVEALPADERTNPAAYSEIAAKIDDVGETIRQKGGAQ